MAYTLGSKNCPGYITNRHSKGCLTKYWEQTHIDMNNDFLDQMRFILKSALESAENITMDELRPKGVWILYFQPKLRGGNGYMTSS